MIKKVVTLSLFVLTFSVFAQVPANDNCATATVLVYEAAAINGTTVNATASGQTACSGTADDDVWYKFTPTVSGNTIITVAGATNFDAVIQISSTCGTTLNELYCGDFTNSGEIEKAILATTSGVTYYARVYSYGNDAVSKSTFSISVKNVIPPVNDNCTGAIVLTYGATSIAGTTINSTASGQASCQGIADDDVWYKFTPIVTGNTTISVTDAKNFNAVVQISSTCGTILTVIDCGNRTNGTTDNGVERMVLPTTAGVTYYIRIYSYDGGVDVMSTFKIDINNNVPPPNDNCTGASTLISGTELLEGTTINATASGQLACTGTANDDVWYKYTETVTGYTVISIFAGMYFNPIIQVSSTCGTTLTEVECTSNQMGEGIKKLAFAATAGVTYYIRVYSYGDQMQNMFTFTIGVNNSIPPANDNCIGATNLTYGGNARSGITISATGSGQAVCAGSADDDVWYKFVPTVTGSTIVTVTGASDFDAVLQVSSTCGTTLTNIACTDVGANGDIETSIFPTNAGITYYIRIYSYGVGVSSMSTFSIGVNSSNAVINDNCNTAIPLTFADLPLAGNTVNATPSGQSVCAGVADEDVWYSFTPTVTGNVAVSIVGASGFDPVVQISSTCGSTLTSEVCVNQTATGGIERALFSAVAGTTYYARVYDATTALYGSFTIAVNTTTVPNNDDCTSPIVLSYGMSATAGNTVNATASGQVACLGIADDDVWFSFTPTVTSNTSLKLVETAGFDGVVQITSNCGAILTQVMCVDNTNGGATETLLFSTIAGTTYFARVYDAGTGITGAFTIQVEIPFNDECVNATLLTYEAAPLAGTTANATASGQLACTGVADDDVWYKFTPTVTSNTAVTLVGAAAFNGVIQVSSTCGTTLNKIACVNYTGVGAIEKAIFPTTSGVTYYVRVYDFETSNTGTFTIAINNSIPVLNDNCNTATLLTIDAAETSGTTLLATPSVQASCLGTADDDVWYKFKPTVTGYSLITLKESVGFNGVIQVSSNCGTTLNQLSCINLTSGGGVETALLATTAGVTYYIRIYDLGAGFASSPTFKISVTKPIPEINVKQLSDIASGSSFNFENLIGTPGAFTIENKTLGSTLALSGSPNKVVISGMNASDFIVNETLTSNSILGGSNTTFTVTFNPSSLGVKNAVITIQNNDSDENPYVINLSGVYTNYALGNVTAFCGVTNSYCLPLKAIAPISNGIIGLDFAINYNSNMFTPVGTATMGPVSTSYGTYLLNTSTPGKVYVTVFLSAAPVNTYMSGLGDIICIDFNLASGAVLGSSAVFSTDPIVESFPLNSVNMGPAQPSNFSYIRGMVGQLYYRNSTAPSARITNVAGSTTTRVRVANPDCTPLSGSMNSVNSNGQVSLDITGSSKIIIERDILGDLSVPVINCENIQSVISAIDRNMAAQISNSTLAFPSLYELIAADVNMDGKVTAGDAALISQRTINSGYCEFPQTFNYTWNGTTLIPATNYIKSKDWLFIDQATLNDPAFTAAMSKDNVPKLPACLSASVISPACTTKADVVYQAILLGDVNGSWLNTNSAIARVTSNAEIVVDLYHAIPMGNNTFKIPVTYSSEEDFYGLDMEINYSDSKIDILNVIQNRSLYNLGCNWNDIDKKRLMLTSYSDSGVNTDQPIFYIEVHSIDAKISALDLGTINAYLNEQTVIVRIAENELITNIKKISILNTITVYPNPASDIISIGGIDESYSIKIYNSIGIEVYQNENSIQDIDISEFSSGIYFLKLESSLGEKTISFIKVK